VPTIHDHSKNMVGTAQERLCPPYDFGLVIACDKREAFAQGSATTEE
jgi:hypothetical protein